MYIQKDFLENMSSFLESDYKFTSTQYTQSNKHHTL